MNLNLSYVKNIEGKYGFYMNGGLVKGDYVAKTFNALTRKHIELEQKLAKAEAALKVYEEAVENAIEAKTKIGTDLTLVYAQQKVKELLGSEG